MDGGIKIYTIIIEQKDDVLHYGTKRHSGRYPYGSGERPFQSEDRSKIQKGISEKKKLAKEVLNIDLSEADAKSRNRHRNDSVFTLPKGSQIQHITGVPIKELRSGQFYVTATDYDNKLYQAFLGMRLKSRGWNPQKVSVTLKEDLKVPSKKTQMRIFEEMIKNDRNQIISDISEWLYSKGKVDSVKDGISKESSKSLRDLYLDFNNSLEYSTKSSKRFLQKLQDMGYNGVVDEHDIYGSWMQGELPIIVIDAISTCGDLKITDLTSDKLLTALEDYMNLNRERR